MITIDDQFFQIFCFGRYIKPVNGELSETQKITLASFKRFNGDIEKMAVYQRITKMRVRSHLVSIKNKGWEV